MPTWITALLSLAGNLFGWLNKRSDLANDPVIKQNKIAQADQVESDRIERLVRTATKDPDAEKRAAAAAELQKLDSE